MFIEPTITWVPLGFSGYIWLDTKIVLYYKPPSPANLFHATPVGNVLHTGACADAALLTYYLPSSLLIYLQMLLCLLIMCPLLP